LIARDELFIGEPHGHLGLSGRVIITSNHQIVRVSSTQITWDCQQLRDGGVADSRFHFLGEYNGVQIFTVELSPEEWVAMTSDAVGLRSLLGEVPDGMFRLLGRAVQINDWYNSHRFCGCCGSATAVVANERAMACTQCRKVYYPRLSPCIMALVTRGEECLLARNAQWQVPRYSVVAGFIEPGESVEDAIHREVKEEVGVQVHNLRYFSSQPWPFPGQLMIGFVADHLAGEIRVDGVEIAEANWYHYTSLPNIPNPLSLSGQLIQHFVERCRQAS